MSEYSNTRAEMYRMEEEADADASIARYESAQRESHVVTRRDVERAVHKARSLVTVQPLPDDMAVIAGPRGHKEKPLALRKVRSLVRRQQIDIALGNIPLDDVTWRNKARIMHSMGPNSGVIDATKMVDAICKEFCIEEANNG